MAFQDVQLLIAQARVEADNPAFRVELSLTSTVFSSLSYLRHIFLCMFALEESHAQADETLLVDGEYGSGRCMVAIVFQHVSARPVCEVSGP